MRLGRRVGAVCATVGLLVGTGWTVDASASTDLCGTVISRSTTLKADVGPCPADGLVVSGSNITLNLGGYKVFGAFDGEHGVATGNHAGIRLVNVSGVTVKNGEVYNFAAGVAVHGGSGNSFTGLDLHHNVGPAGTNDLGDGLALFDSVNNTITNNKAHHNGPFSGMALVGTSSRNTVSRNDLSDNATHDLCGREGGVPGPTTCEPYQPIWGEDNGLRLEGPGAANNLVSGNQVNRNGSEGIYVAMTCPNFDDPVNFPPPCEGAGLSQSNNVIRGNTVNDNGVLGAPSAEGSGILLHNIGFSHAPSYNSVTSNVVLRNERNGLFVSLGAHHNTLRGNTATDNAGWDGLDANEACDANVWSNNTLITYNQPCVAGRSGGGPRPAAAGLTTRSAPPGVERKPGTARATS